MAEVRPDRCRGGLVRRSGRARTPIHLPRLLALHIPDRIQGRSRYDLSGAARWLSGVDSGSPLVIYVISASLTSIFRLPVLYLTGCLKLSLIPAL